MQCGIWKSALLKLRAPWSCLHVSSPCELYLPIIPVKTSEVFRQPYGQVLKCTASLALIAPSRWRHSDTVADLDHESVSTTQYQQRPAPQLSRWPTRAEIYVQLQQNPESVAVVSLRHLARNHSQNRKHSTQHLILPRLLLKSTTRIIMVHLYLGIKSRMELIMGTRPKPLRQQMTEQYCKCQIVAICRPQHGSRH